MIFVNNEAADYSAYKELRHTIQNDKPVYSLPLFICMYDDIFY